MGAGRASRVGGDGAGSSTAGHRAGSSTAGDEVLPATRAGKRAGGPAPSGGDEASGDPAVRSSVPSWLPPDRPLRADARRNRDAVLTAAAEAFAAQGVEAPLEDIARRAGVGVGTLYRHFPTREALVFGVYAREVETLAGSADQLAREREPADALREWMRRFVHYAVTKRGLKGMLRTMMADDSELFDRSREQVDAAAAGLLASAAAAGQIRDDVTAEDLVRSMGGICMAGGPDNEPECAGRLVDLVFDGLRYGAPAAR